MPADDTSTNSSVEEGPSSVNNGNVPVRPAPPKIPKIPPPPEDHPPPYSSYHAQASGLLSSSSNPQARTHSQSAINRNSRTPPGYRRYTQYLTKRNLLILIGVFFLLFAVVAVISWISGSDDSDEYYVPTPKSPTFDRTQTQKLDLEWHLLGAFTEHEQRMSFDENTDSVILSKYLPDEHLLKSEKLEVDQSHNKYISSTNNISQIYEDCIRFTDNAICCSTSPHGHNHRTDCFLNIDDQIIKSVATHYDFKHDGWQSLNDGNFLLIVFNKQRHAILNLKTKRIHKIEENRLPDGYISTAFFFPMDNADELEELVHTGQDFRICEYKQTLAGDYALQAPECRNTPFHVEFELPKVRFCSNPIYTAVVQYGHFSDERDLTFQLKLVFDGSAEAYTARDSLESNYDQLVMDCNDETVEIYAMGMHEIARFTIRLPNLRSEHFIQNRL